MTTVVSDRLDWRPARNAAAVFVGFGVVDSFFPQFRFPLFLFSYFTFAGPITLVGWLGYTILKAIREFRTSLYRRGISRLFALPLAFVLFLYCSVIGDYVHFLACLPYYSTHLELASRPHPTAVEFFWGGSGWAANSRDVWIVYDGAPRVLVEAAASERYGGHVVVTRYLGSYYRVERFL